MVRVSKEIKFKKLSSEARLDFPAIVGDVGYDLYSIEAKWIFPLFPRRIKTGMTIESPKDYYCTIETRSGHGVKKHLRVHRGIIDNGYRGEVDTKIYNHGFFPYRVKKGEKIAQVIFHKAEVFPLKEVQELSETSRGKKGFGSTN